MIYTEEYYNEDEIKSCGLSEPDKYDDLFAYIQSLLDFKPSMETKICAILNMSDSYEELLDLSKIAGLI